MDINRAFEFLELSIGASKEEIEKQFKKLSQVFHPDKGGTNEAFNELVNARELALIYVENKALIVISNQLLNQELVAINKKNEANEEVRTILNKKERKFRSRYQKAKDTTLTLTVIVGALTLISTQLKDETMFPIMDPFYKRMFLLYGLAFGVMYLFFNFYTNRLKDRIDELKEMFDNKEEMYEVIVDIFGENNTQPLTKEDILLLIKERYLSKQKFISRLKYILSIIGINNNNNSSYFASYVRIIGYQDFGKILILKGVSNKFFEEIEQKSGDPYILKYKLKEFKFENVL